MPPVALRRCREQSSRSTRKPCEYTFQPGVIAPAIARNTISRLTITIVLFVLGVSPFFMFVLILLLTVIICLVSLD